MAESKGAQLINRERLRQITEKGWTPEHDDEHHDGALAMAACCYAAPLPIFVWVPELKNRAVFVDPWPWEDGYDNRYRCGGRAKIPGPTLPNPGTYTPEERLDLLVKAGALIAAEIDRLLRLKGSEPTTPNPEPV